ncbi:phage tail protein [Escherichia coli]|nr:phage tail protein [Escherichia coli]
MTVKYYAILTNQGAARLANATMLGSKLNLTQMAVGDANGVLPTPDPAQTKLINQKRIAPLNLLSVDPNNQSQIIAEQIIPENEGGFWIREIGLYDDEGVLIAVANCPETYKPQLQEGSGRTQTIRMILVVTNTEAITLKIDPSVVLATRKYVDDKISEHEQSRRHPDASLTAKGFTQLSSAINSESETLAATPKAVKAAYDLADGKYTAQNATTTQKGIVQLSSATNSTSETLAATPKAVKAVMDETSKKAPLNSPALTGTPTTPTAPQGTNSTQIASTAFVMAAIAALVDSSPDALNTLNELAAALGNDPNFATTMTNALAGKQPKDATLTALAELATSADKLPYFTGADRAALTSLTSVGRAILGKTSTQEVLDYLGLGASAFGLKNVVYYTSAQVVQWPVPDILKQGRRCYVVVIGGGASGAYGNEKAGGTGGSSGGRSEKIVDLTGVDAVTVTVGAGGAAIGSNNSAGNPGGTSSFGTYLSATGAPATNIFSSQPGGKGIGGDVNIAGFPGTPAVVCSTDGKRTGGNGGGPGAGAGKYDTTQQGAEYERNARFPGSGGAGLAYYSGLTGSTGRGADGAVYIYW